MTSRQGLKDATSPQYDSCTFAYQNVIQLKRQHRTGRFSGTDGFTSILFQFLMLKYASHYSWLLADCICYPYLLPLSDAASNLQIWKFYGAVSISESVFTIHPGGQAHSPVTWWQTPPFWHGHLSSHCGPCFPGGHRSSQLERWSCTRETRVTLAHIPASRRFIFNAINNFSRQQYETESSTT